MKASAVAFLVPDFTNSGILGVFTQEDKSQPTCHAIYGGKVVAETLPIGEEIHANITRALQLSGETGSVYGLTPDGVIKKMTLSELAALPKWAAYAAELPK